MNETVFVKKIKHENFTTVDNGFIRNNSLSWKSKGILLYLVSLPDNWILNLNELKNHATDGIASLRAGLNELRLLGYLNISPLKDESGKFTGTKYEVDEYGMLPKQDAHKTNKEPEADKPKLENLKAENLKSENQTLLNTNNNQILNKLNTNIPSLSDYEARITQLEKELEESKKLNEANASSSKKSKKSKKNDYTPLLSDDFYKLVFAEYKRVFFGLNNGGIPNAKDYKQNTDKAIVRLRELGMTDADICSKIFEAIHNAPSLEYWRNTAKGSFAYIVSEAGMNHLTGKTTASSNKGSAIAQLGGYDANNFELTF